MNCDQTEWEEGKKDLPVVHTAEMCNCGVFHGMLIGTLCLHIWSDFSL